jgi:hypothetical protein
MISFSIGSAFFRRVRIAAKRKVAWSWTGHHSFACVDPLFACPAALH